jgi:hypothetical protein
VDKDGLWLIGFSRTISAQAESLLLPCPPKAGGNSNNFDYRALVVLFD